MADLSSSKTRIISTRFVFLSQHPHMTCYVKEIQPHKSFLKTFNLENRVQMQGVRRTRKRSSPLRKEKHRGIKLQLPGSPALPPDCVLAPGSRVRLCCTRVFRDQRKSCCRTHVPYRPQHPAEPGGSILHLQSHWETDSLSEGSRVSRDFT